MRLVAGVTHDLRSSGGEGLLYRGSQRTFSVHCRKSVLGWGHPGGQGEGRGGLQDDPVKPRRAAKRIGTAVGTAEEHGCRRQTRWGGLDREGGGSDRDRSGGTYRSGAAREPGGL
jgi:hypothetical protein